MRAATFTFSALVFAATAVAQAPIPAGDPFPISTFTTGSQMRPAVALDGTGNFVVVWDGASAADAAGIQGRLFAADGTALGAPFQVNTATAGSQSWASVARHADGAFVVAWESMVSPTISIQAQLFAANGSKLGGEFQVNTLTAGAKGNPSVAMDADGDFVVVWDSVGSSGSDADGRSIQGQRYDAAGLPVGGEFQVNSSPAGDQEDPEVAMAPDGSFVAVWTSIPGTGSTIRAQRFSSDGSTVGGEFQVSAVSTPQAVQPDVAVDAQGDFFVVWTTPDDFDGTGRRYASDGTDLGFFDLGIGVIVPAAATGGGDRVAVWTDPNGNGLGKVWDTGGDVVHDEFVLPSTEVYGFEPDAAMDGGGNFLIVWWFVAVEGQRYLSRNIFADGFESGDLAAWSAALP